MNSSASTKIRSEFTVSLDIFHRETHVSAADGKWHHICATWENTAGSWKLYKDGVVVELGQGLKKGTYIHCFCIVLKWTKSVRLRPSVKSVTMTDLDALIQTGGTKLRSRVSSYLVIEKLEGPVRDRIEGNALGFQPVLSLLTGKG